MQPVIIGDATLYCGDCIDILPTLPKADVCMTDPPYGIGFAAQPTRYQRANGMTAVAWDDATPSAECMAVVLAAAERVCIWGGNYFALPPSRGWLAWSKVGNAPSMADLELAWTNVDMNARSFEKSVKSASLEKNLQNAAHPTQKPLALMEWSIQQLRATEAVVDPFMGSGTTGVAAVNLGLPFIGIEREPKYFDIACRRIEQAYAQRPLFAAEPPPKPEQMEIA